MKHVPPVSSEVWSQWAATCMILYCMHRGLVGWQNQASQNSLWRLGFLRVSLLRNAHYSATPPTVRLQVASSSTNTLSLLTLYIYICDSYASIHCLFAILRDIRNLLHAFLIHIRLTYCIAVRTSCGPECYGICPSSSIDVQGWSCGEHYDCYHASHVWACRCIVNPQV